MMFMEICIAAGTHQLSLYSPTKSPLSYRSKLKLPGVGDGYGGGVGVADGVAELVASGDFDGVLDTVGAVVDDGVAGSVALTAACRSRAQGVVAGPGPRPLSACPVAYTVPTARKMSAKTSPTWATRTGWRTRRSGRRQLGAKRSGVSA